jgi:hypothetical protein
MERGKWDSGGIESTESFARCRDIYKRRDRERERGLSVLNEKKRTGVSVFALLGPRSSLSYLGRGHSP